ncbi:hypothetical protein SLS63_007681 [Diaporthe eres]|uniref:Uncharacterized protein n=1 Tax=Diaporthe eres TaxID=83184 RepID=A0ABR1P5F7_DIAER
MFDFGRLLGWNSEKWPRYLGFSTLLVIGELAFIFILRLRYLAVRESTPLIDIILICGVWTPSMIGLFFGSGPSCMFPRQHGVSLMSKHGCCGQGLVFPQQRVVEDMLPLYRNTNEAHAAVDTFVEDYANTSDELRWAVTPVLIQHVGGKNVPHYIPNASSLNELLVRFASLLSITIFTALWLATRFNANMRPSDKLIFGYFVLNHANLAASNDLFAQLWKEYALSDSRYLTSDPFMICVETITVV